MSWRAFFDNHAPHYMDNPFTQNTLAEVRFLIEELRIEPGQWVLDVGCGTGRHGAELVECGYRVTGIDISPKMLARAQRLSPDAEWIRCDATEFLPTRIYDAAYCVCEGAFGLVTPDDDPEEHDLKILQNVRRALKDGGRFVLNALNGSNTGTRAFEVSSGLLERTYVEADLAALVERAGFSVEHIGGGTAGQWGRRPLDPDEVEMMCIAVAQ